jgi:hypothetical protein
VDDNPSRQVGDIKGTQAIVARPRNLSALLTKEFAGVLTAVIGQVVVTSELGVVAAFLVTFNHTSFRGDVAVSAVQV